MAKTVSAQKIWEALLKDPEFTVQPKVVQEAMKPFIDALPETLGDLLGAPVTLSNLAKAKVTFLRYCLDHGFIEIMVDAMPEESLGFFDREDLPGMFKDLFGQLIDVFEPLVENALVVLKAQGMIEDQVMTSPRVGLSGKALKLYKAHKLTVGDLLELQPMVVVSNQNK